MSLTRKELDALLNLINSENTNNQTFETIANQFHSVLPKTSLFKICNALVIFLNHSADLLPSSSQRLAALFLIFECYRNDEFVNNPFAPVFAELLKKNGKRAKQSDSIEIFNETRSFNRTISRPSHPTTRKPKWSTER